MRHSMIRWLLAASCALAFVAGDSASADESAAKAIDSFTLRDFRGREFSLEQIAGEKATVVAFLGTECPLAKQYGPRLAELEKEYGARGVKFVAIDSNQQDSLAELAAFARDAKIEFPLLKDGANAVADQFGAARTPEAFLIDAERKVRYRGRIDDQYGYQKQGIAYQRKAPGRRDLAEAIEDVLAGRPVQVAQTEAIGCLIGRVKQVDPSAEVTYSNQIARVFQKRCIECHRAGEIGPFPLATYEDTVGWGEMIREVTRENRMPPWHADAAHGEFSNDARLTDEEKSLVDRWVAAGCPEGDRGQLPPAIEYPTGWRIGTPERVIAMREEPFRVPARGVVQYEHFVVDPGFSEDMWVQAAEVRAGNRAVVHHIIVMLKEPGKPASGAFNSYLVAMAPGTPPMRLEKGQAKRIPAGSKLVFQVHYTTNGSEQVDLSSLGLIFTDPQSVVEEVKTGSAVNLALFIPPNDPNYSLEAWRTLRRDVRLLELFPHMHLRGKAFRYTAVYPDGRREILLDVPQYDFNWQNVYKLKEPKSLPKGTRIECLAQYDNSAENLANPNPNQFVHFGDQTFDEMLIGYFNVALPRDGNSTPAVEAEVAEATSDSAKR